MEYDIYKDNAYVGTVDAKTTDEARLVALHHWGVENKAEARESVRNKTPFLLPDDDFSVKER